MTGKITDLGSLTGANFNAGDLLEVVDVTDTSLAATGTNKKSRADEVAIGLGNLRLAFPYIYVGSSYLRAFVPIINSSSESAGTTVRAYPCWAPRAVTITSFGFNVTTSEGGASMRVGMYTDNVGQPNTLIAELGDASVASTGNVTVTGLSQALPAGPFWIAHCLHSSSNTAQFRGTNNSVYSFGSHSGVNFAAASLGVISPNSGSSGLPGSFGTPSSIIQGTAIDVVVGY